MTLDDGRAAASRDELASRMSSLCVNEGRNPAADGLDLYKHCNVSQPTHGQYSPSICVIAQGAKEVVLGDERFRYDPAHFVLASLDIPVVTQVVEATPKRPFLGLKLDLSPSLIASVCVEAGIAPSRSESSVRSIAVSKLNADLLDAFVRLLRLVETPSDYRVVSPMVIKEIVYRLLKSDQGPRLSQMANFGGTTHRITRAVDMLRTKFNESLSIEDLAGELGMSVSSFHQHFKTVTSMSPLQFQKMLRLQEARRLLLTGEVDASSAASRVGYDDASQFSREYKRLFGDPPMRDVGRFKQASAHV